MLGNVFALQLMPLFEEIRDGSQETMCQFGIRLDRHEEVRRPHDESGQIERPPGNGETDLVAQVGEARLGPAQPTEHEWQQAVRPRIGLRQLRRDLYGSRKGRDKGKLISWKLAASSESRGIRAHAELGPETGDERTFRKGFNGCLVGGKPEVLIDEIVYYVAAHPAGEPGAIDDEACRGLYAGCTVYDADQLLPLLVSHGGEKG